jgi:hypothetical protein
MCLKTDKEYKVKEFNDKFLKISTSFPAQVTPLIPGVVGLLTLPDM